MLVGRWRARWGCCSRLGTDMDITTTIGGDGVRYTQIQMPGSMRLGDKVYEGVFEYIIDPDGWINHRFFRPN